MGTFDRVIKFRFSSLQARILWFAAIVVIIFVVITALILRQTFKHGLVARLQSQLEVQTWALLGVADELGPGQLYLPEAMQDQHLNQLSSGRYARVINDKGKEVWRSASAIGLKWSGNTPLLSGDSLFFKTNIGTETVYERDFGVTWESSTKDIEENHYTFQVAESSHSIDHALSDFNQQLTLWLGLLGLGLLIVQVFFIRVGLAPLKRIINELKDIEQGQNDQLSEDYPDELKSLAHRINRLLKFEQNQRVRYRNSLGDLAHSLKTPLSVLRTSLQNIEYENASDEGNYRDPKFLDQQLTRINKSLSYYLNRASMIGGGSTLTPIKITNSVEELIQAMDKVYRDKRIKSSMNVKGEPLFFGNEGDFMELAGNLIENAYKYGESKVRIKLIENYHGMSFSVDNDGVTIGKSKKEQVLKRGARLDQKDAVSGYGIGLSIVHDIVKAYEGKIEIITSELGGTCFVISFNNP